MSKISEILANQDVESVKNSYYRAPKVNPSVSQPNPKSILISTVEETVTLNKIDEVILYIISSFKFSPIWMLEQWFEQYSLKAEPVIISWVNIGLVWLEESAMGPIVRPTLFLLNLFKEEATKYSAVPFNLMNHTCSEQSITFDIFMGNSNSELWNILKDETSLLPAYHPLGIKPDNDTGTVAIREGEFKIAKLQVESELTKIITNEEEIYREMQARVKYSKEFADFSKFPIIKIDKDTGKVTMQTPDIIVPVGRKEGKPQSCAIEIELSSKHKRKYDQILFNYKNNIKFGKLFYLVGDRRIGALIKESYKRIGGLGMCELYLVPYSPPAQTLKNYFNKEIYGEK